MELSDDSNQGLQEPVDKSKGAPAKEGIANEDLPALFWDEMPSNASEHSDMVALQALNDETTPKERALSFKEQGNRALQTGMKQRKKFYLRQAIESYTEGINLEFDDAHLKSVLYSNRAQANLVIGNYRNALFDGQDAIRFNEQNIKGFYRAAKGALGTSKFDKCQELCDEALKLSSVMSSIEISDFSSLKKRAEEKKEELQLRKDQEAKQYVEVRAPARRLAQAILNKGWKIGRPQFSVEGHKPRMEPNGEISWPVLFFYPEASMQSDVIEAFDESDQFSAHLDRMFSNEAPPLPWDDDRKYRRNTIDAFYLSNAAKPLNIEELTEALYGGWPSVSDATPARYGDRAAEWVQVKESQTLGDILCREDFVVPGIPAFFILAKTTPFRKSFLSGDIPSL